MNYLDKQIKDAKYNYNYFCIKLIFVIFKILVKLSIILLLSNIFNNVIMYIVAIIYTLYCLFNIGNMYNYYLNIINDIRDNLGYDMFFFEIDFSLIKFNLFKGLVKYGK